MNARDETAIVGYKTCRECFEAFLGCPVSKAKPIAGYYQCGTPYKFSALKFLRMARRKGCWGWTDKGKIHFWIGKRASLLDAVRFFAHERGHQMRPFHKSKRKEEMKAGTYEEVAAFALCVAQMAMAGQLSGANDIGTKEKSHESNSEMV